MERDYKAGTVSVQAFSEFYVSTLAGRTAAQWEPLRQAFLREVVAPRIGEAARALVQRQHDHGALVVLTTATNRYLTELTARELGIEHLIANPEFAKQTPPRGCRNGRFQRKKFPPTSACEADHFVPLDILGWNLLRSRRVEPFLSPQ